MSNTTADVELLFKQMAISGDIILLNAVPNFGPHANAQIIVVTSREHLSGALTELPKNNNRTFLLHNLSDSIKMALNDTAQPDKNQDLMDDLLILFACKLVMQVDTIIEGAGLSSLLLLINEDDSLSWQQRGMLDPEMLKNLGFG